MLIKVKVFPDSKKEEIIKKSKDSFEIKVKEKLGKGLANKAVINALFSYFKISSSRVKLIRGFKQRNKNFERI